MCRVMLPMCVGDLPAELRKLGVVQPWMDHFHNYLHSAIKEIREETQDKSQAITEQVA